MVFLARFAARGVRPCLSRFLPNSRATTCVLSSSPCHWFSSKNNNSGDMKDDTTKKIVEDFLEGKPLQQAAGSVLGSVGMARDADDDSDNKAFLDAVVRPQSSKYFIPQDLLPSNDGNQRKRVLVLCTGGTITMVPDPSKGGALVPQQGALIKYLEELRELNDEGMPEIVAFEYQPFYDSR